jgi:hypothetical protein
MSLAEATKIIATHESSIYETQPRDELSMRRMARYGGHITLERLQAEDDATTQLAELVDGSMYTEFELTLRGDDLYGRDGRNMGDATLKALEDAKQAAKKNPNLWFEVGRRSTERDEYLIAVDMAKGNGPNTMLIQSDLPSALQNATEDVGGYNVTRKIAMERAFIRRPDGKIKMLSKSLDGSNRQALGAIYTEFDHVVAPGETLAQRILIDLSPEEQDGVMDRVVEAYDQEMSKQFGGEWYAGRRPADYRNTYDFVCRQADLVEVWVAAKLDGTLTDAMKYDIAATMQERFEKDATTNHPAYKKLSVASVGVAAAARVEIDTAAIYYEMQAAGNSARAEGKVFSACGATLKADGSDGSLEEQLKGAGYNDRNKAETTSWHGGKKYYNAKCQSCNKVKKEVGACHICQDCVKQPKKSKATD